MRMKCVRQAQNNFAKEQRVPGMAHSLSPALRMATNSSTGLLSIFVMVPSAPLCHL